MLVPKILILWNLILYIFIVYSLTLERRWCGLGGTKTQKVQVARVGVGGVYRDSIYTKSVEIISERENIS